MGLFNDSERMTAFVVVNIIMCIIGSSAAAVNIMLIRRMTITGYLLLLFTICIFQFVYDVTFFFSNVNLGYWVTTVANCFQIISGIGGCLMSNFIALVVFYIVSRKKSFDIFRWYKYMVAICMTVAVINLIVYLVGRIPEHADPYLANWALQYLNYYIWLGSIFSNFIIFGMSAYCIRKMRSIGRKRSDAEQAVSTLSKRLIFYPIVQAIGRSGIAFYEARYDNDFNVDSASDLQYAGLIFLSVITPLVSVGYLLLLVLLQPTAGDEFRAMLGLPPLPKPQVEATERPSRNTVLQRRSTAHNSRNAPSADVELLRRSTTGWFRQSSVPYPFADADGSERGTSIAAWAKSSLAAFWYEDDGLGGMDGRTDAELFAVLAGQDAPSVVTDASTTTNSLHQHSRYSGESLSTISSARHIELSSMGSASASASVGVRSTESSVDP